MTTTISGKPLFPIGIGTWKIDTVNFEQSLEVLRYAFSKGQNFIEVNASYDAGEILDKVLSKFIQRIPRNEIFINVVLTYGLENLNQVDSMLDSYIKVLGINQVDCVTYGTTLDNLEKVGIKTKDYLNKIRELQRQGKTRYIGMSNLSPEEYKKYGPFDHFEGLYNFECRVYEDTGVIQNAGNSFCAFQPLRRGRTAQMDYPVLKEIATKYGMTQNQVILNWIVNHKGIHVLNKSSNRSHVDENIAALDFEITANDYAKLDNFRSKFFDSLDVVYHTPTEEEKANGKIVIHQVPNQDPQGKEVYKSTFGTAKEIMKF